MLYFIIILILGIWIAAAVRNSETVILSHWHHLFDNAQFSSNEIYHQIEDRLKQKQIKDIQQKRITLSEGGMLSSNREYLRVNRLEIYYDICAAPFGTGFFISWWQLYRPSIWTIIISKIPFMSIVALRMTYFQVDSETMFKETVHHAVLDVLHDLSSTKGLRGLTELEQVPIDVKSFIK